MKAQMPRRILYARSSTRGSFIVEFSIVGLIFAAALAFCSDAVTMLATKGKLDRLAYSGVSLIKERSALFDAEELDVTSDEFKEINVIIQNSLKRMMSDFKPNRYGIRLETWDPDNKNKVHDLVDDLECMPEKALSEDMSVTTTWGRSAALYRITLCYKTPSWFSKFGTGEQGFVQTNALMIAR